MKKSIELSHTQIGKNIEALKAFMKKNNLESFYVSSYDPFLGEYVPLENCHRYYFSGFTGSMAEVLVPLEGKVRLYVDGRYHEQADLETDANLVEVVKCSLDKRTIQALFDDLLQLDPELLGFEGDRTPLSLERKFQDSWHTKAFDHEELSQVVNFEPVKVTGRVKLLPKEVRCQETKEKLGRIFSNQELKESAYFLTALEDIAWITNCRGYQLPHLSSFMARALMTAQKVYVFVDENCPLDMSIRENHQVDFLKGNLAQMKVHLERLNKELSPQKVIFDPALINSADSRLLSTIFGPAFLQEKKGGLVDFRSIKTTEELEQFKQSFDSANQAIAKTIRWVRQELRNKKAVSEIDFYQSCNDHYAKEGALGQSFNTISAIEKNSSIIHFGSPSAEIKADVSDLMLLDSGGYFAPGFATDTTRTFLAGGKLGKATAKQKEIYTLVLKSCLQVHMLTPKAGTIGKEVDAVARKPLQEKGYDYNHGTGHGVGIYVHEGGINFGTKSETVLKAGQVVSVEPGIYIPGFGGVRIENIVVIEDHPEKPGHFKFRPLTYIGFDSYLIEESLLTSEEKAFLASYESECARRGTSFLQNE